MFFIGIVVLAGIYIMGSIIVDNVKRRKQCYDWRANIAGTLFIGSLLTCIVGWLVAWAIGGPVGHLAGVRPEYDPYTFSIVAAADGSQTSGSFYLFGGTIDEDPVYFYYRERSDGSIRQGYIPTGKSVIYEDTENEGYIQVNRYRDAFCEFWGCAWDMAGSTRSNKYEIHVPPGSVKRQFNFDLE